MHGRAIGCVFGTREGYEMDRNPHRSNRAVDGRYFEGRVIVSAGFDGLGGFSEVSFEGRSSISPSRAWRTVGVGLPSDWLMTAIWKTGWPRSSPVPILFIVVCCWRSIP